MTKTLTLIAAASFVLAVACLSGAAALGWHGVHGHHWNWGPGNWTMEVRDSDNDVHTISHFSTSDSADGSSATREIAWNGTDKLDVDIDADVQFTQAPGPAKLVVSGPKDAVEHVVLDGSHLQYDDNGDYSGKLKVTLSAPNVSQFAINGSGALAIDGYNQDQLGVDVSGSGDVTAKGKTRQVKLDISGDGNVDMSGLVADSAEAQISGSGRASIAPTSAADLHISGDGEIDLKSHPPRLTSDVSGSGRIVEGDAAKPS
jgi:hypothetical protein